MLTRLTFLSTAALCSLLFLIASAGQDAKAQNEPRPCRKELVFVGRIHSLEKMSAPLGPPICQYKIDIIEQPIPDAECPLTAQEANLLTFADSKCIRRDREMIRGIISVFENRHWIQTLD